MKRGNDGVEHMDAQDAVREISTMLGEVSTFAHSTTAEIIEGESDHDDEN